MIDSNYGLASLGCGVSKLTLHADCTHRVLRVLFIFVLSCNVNTGCMFLTKNRSVETVYRFDGKEKRRKIIQYAESKSSVQILLSRFRYLFFHFYH